MTNNLFKSLLFAVPLTILGACSEETPVIPGDDSNISQNTETRYLRVNLVNNGASAGTRAADGTPDAGDLTGGYTPGTDAENMIKTLDFYFYDANKEYHSHVKMDPSSPMLPTQPGATGNVFGFYESNVPVNLVQGEAMPTYVLCIVNAVKPAFYENKSMEVAQKDLLDKLFSPEVGPDGKKDTYFGMNNSVYYGLDEVTGLPNQLIMATPFDTNKLFTKTDLDKMGPTELNEATIDIYVERYAAKINFNIADDAYVDFTGDAATESGVNIGDVTLSFVPQGWGLNAFEEEFFFLKAFRVEGLADYSPDFSTFGDIDKLLFAGWNNEAQRRSFWSRSPAYYYDSYPLVADDVKTDEQSGPLTEGKYRVKYQKFNTVNAPSTPISM